MKTFTKVALGTMIAGAIVTPIAVAIRKKLKFELDPKDLVLTEEDYAKLKASKQLCDCGCGCDCENNCECTCHDDKINTLDFSVETTPVQKINFVFTGSEFLDKNGNVVSDEDVVKALDENDNVHFDIKDAIDKHFNGDVSAFESVLINEMFGIDDKYNPAEHLRKIFERKENSDNEKKA